MPNTPTTLTKSEVSQLIAKSTLGNILGKNLERASAGWSLVLSFLLVMFHPASSGYTLMSNIARIEVWGWVFGLVAMGRVVTLIVNGWWPVTLQVRIIFSVVTMLFVWGVVTASSFYAAFGSEQYQWVLPSLALAPFAVTVEMLCFIALRTRLAVVKGNDNVGSSYPGPSGNDQQHTAGIR